MIHVHSLVDFVICNFRP